MRQKTHYLILMLVLMVAVTHAGCVFSSGSWRKQAVTSYEITGETLISTKKILKAACADGTLSTAQCARAKQYYDTTVRYYKEMGNTIIISIDVEDKIQRKRYYELKKDIQEMIILIENLLGRNM